MGRAISAAVSVIVRPWAVELAAAVESTSTPSCSSSLASVVMSASSGRLLRRQRLFGQQRGRHQRQGRVLRAAHLDFATQRTTAPDPDLVQRTIPLSQGRQGRLAALAQLPARRQAVREPYRNVGSRRRFLNWREALAGGSGGAIGKRAPAQFLEKTVTPLKAAFRPARQPYPQCPQPPAPRRRAVAPAPCGA